MSVQDNINLESMLKTGTVLHGDYRIDGYLSSGGFGNTYVVTHIHFSEKYAIKEFFMRGVTQRDGTTNNIIVSNNANTDEFKHQLEKFKKEAKRLRALKNDHIVRVHNLFEENGTAYYVMDYIDGEDLRKRLARTQTPLSETEVTEILNQTLDALRAVHLQGIWHLDLKPANIMVDSTGTVNLIDFGASKLFDCNKGGVTSSAVAFTSGYAPIEQMENRSEKFGPWTDFYALGATLYNLLTNRKPPMPSDINDDHTSDKHLALPIPSDISDSMQKLILWMMTPNRSERPASVDKILDFLQVQAPEESVKDDSEETAIPLGGTGQMIQPAPEPTFSVVDGKVYAECSGHTVDLKVNGVAVNNPYTLPAAIHEEQEINFTAYTIKNDDESDNSFEVYYSYTIQPISKSNIKVMLFSFLIGLLIGALSYMLIRHFMNPIKDKTSVENIVEINQLLNVMDLNVTIPIGNCIYSGQINADSVPDGFGIAVFDNDDKLIATFMAGIVNGDGHYYYANGDSFEGAFENNSFKNGRFIKASESGSYFEGSFNNNYPFTGQWYDSNGNLLYILKNGQRAE